MLSTIVLFSYVVTFLSIDVYAVQREQDDNKDVDGNATLGVLLCIVGGVVDNTGVTLQKLSHRQSIDSIRLYYTRPLWILGLSMYLIGSICNAVGLSLAPQSDFAVMGSLTLVSNAVNSRCLLGEGLNHLILIGIAIIIAGSMLAVLFGAPSRSVTVSSIESLDVCAITYVSVLALLIASLYTFIRKIRRQLFMETSTEPSVHLQAMIQPLVPKEKDMVSLRTSTNYFSEASLTLPPYMSMLLPVFSALIGSITVLFVKAMMVMLRASYNGDNQFIHWPIYLAIVMTIFLGATQIHWLNMALKSFDQLIVVPAFAVALESLNVMSGLIFYHESREFSPFQMIIFISGVTLSFIGVLTISIGLKRRRQLFRSIPSRSSSSEVV